MSWLTDWTYRKVVSLSKASGAVTNYQMQVKVGESSGATGYAVHCGGLCKSDFSDIRFTNYTNTILDYWIESIAGTTPNQTATIWVEFDSIDVTTTTFFMYYGNAAASAVSNGKNTFPETFDHFDTGSLDTAVWTQRNGGTLTFSGTEMTAPANAVDPGKLIAKTANTGNYYILRARFKVTGGVNVGERVGIGVKTTDSSTPSGYNYVVNQFTALNSINFLNDWIAWGTNQESSWAKNTYYILEIYHDGTNVKARRDDGTWRTQAWSGRTGYLALNIGSFDSTSVWDWALVRQFTATEPAWGTWSAQETEGNLVGVLSVAQLPIEVLSDNGPAIAYTYAAQLAMEVLSDNSAQLPIAYTYIAQLVVEVLSRPITQWPHKLSSVASVSISKVKQVTVTDINKISGVGA